MQTTYYNIFINTEVLIVDLKPKSNKPKILQVIHLTLVQVTGEEHHYLSALNGVQFTHVQ